MSDMQGKVCLVTGASSGIGREIAKALASQGATVVTVSRGGGSGDEMTAQIRHETRNSDVTFMPADLSSMAEVRRLAERFKSRFDKLDVLVNNAGIFSSKRKLTEDSYERTFALNHLAPFLLTHLLSEPLVKSAPARIVTTSSRGESFGKMHFDDLMLENYGGWKAYGQSKLANLLFTYELSKRLLGTGVTANAFHPGGVATGFGLNNEGFVSFLFGTLVRPFLKTPEQGAESGIYLASSPDAEGITGRYYIDKMPATSSKRSYDAAAQKRLWTESERLTGLSKEESAPLELAGVSA